jgi:hypothetical protein
MSKRVLAFCSFVGGIAWPYLWEFIRSWIYERAQHVIEQYIPSYDFVLHYGPAVVLGCIGLWLFHRAGHPAEGVIPAQSIAPPQGPAADIAASEALDKRIFASVWHDGDAPENRDVTVGEAIAYLCFGEWGKRFLDAAQSSAHDANSKLAEFLQSAADGEIPIWGKKKTGGVYEPIPREFWFKNQIEWFGLLKDAALSESSIGNQGERYFFLMTSRAAMEK